MSPKQALTSDFKLVADVRGRDQTVVSDLHEARGQHVQQESPEELNSIEAAGLALLRVEANLMAVEA